MGTPSDASLEIDALVIGAGPVGLFQVFQLGLQGVRAHVVDALSHAGGQCIELYADKPIYDIPGIPLCTGQELIDRLLLQIRPFNPTFHFDQLVSSFERQADGRILLRTADGLSFRARTVFIAAGVGAFTQRAVQLDGLARFKGSQLFYGTLPQGRWVQQHVLVIGDGDAALTQAITLASAVQDPPKSVTLMHRRDSFKAEADTVARMRALCAEGRMRFVAAQPVGLVVQQERLTALQVADAQASTHELPADLVLACLGVSPALGPLARWGLAMERKQLPVTTEDFATAEPGVYAVGDINTYAGKKKLILCGFHEATLAAFGAAARLFPQQPVQLQYTTTSTRLHQLLGVGGKQEAT